jgi:hypothetical protein
MVLLGLKQVFKKTNDMKPIIKILLIAFAIIFPKLSYGQDYHPMLGDSNKWYVLHTFEGSYIEHFETKGDTSIRGNNYKILFREDNYKNPLVFYREDSINKKVYQIVDTTEIVYLDFSLNENDSIYSEYTTCWYYVDSIRMTNILSGNRKIFYLESLNKGEKLFPVWIEGVGTIGNPLYAYYTPDEWERGQLNCFFKNNIKEYQSERFLDKGGCDITKINNLISNNDIDLWPNPANTQIQIKSALNKLNRLLVFDIYGKKLMVVDDPEIVNIRNLSSGIYFLKLETNSKSIIKKLIINKN